MAEASDATTVERRPRINGACAPSGEALGLALSGGGVRAALFSLGVVLYLVRSGLNKRLRVLISVSGGSITNAALAASGDLSTMTIQEFEPVCQRLASRLAKNGSLFMSKLWWARIGGICLGEGLLGVVVVFLFGLPWTLAIAFAAFWPLFATITTAIQRKSGQLAEYARLIRFAGFGQKDREEKLGEKIPFDKFPPSTVAHVICSTELVSGEPMYFSPCWCYSPVYGWGKTVVTADQAVYASAAFPAAFPPLVVSTDPLQFGGGSTNRDRPRKVLLADGGVYNNLGDDWFTLAQTAETIPWGTDTRFPSVPSVDHRIIVNSSSPAKTVPMPRFWPKRSIISFVRIMAILYENTVRPRIEPLLEAHQSNTTVIDISRSPLTTARTLEKTATDDGTRARAAILAEAVGGLPERYWDELVEDTSLAKTTLSPLGKERSARLIRHGYISAMAALSPTFGLAGLDEVPPERYFIDLVEKGIPAKGAKPSAAEPGQTMEPKGHGGAHLASAKAVVPATLAPSSRRGDNGAA